MGVFKVNIPWSLRNTLVFESTSSVVPPPQTDENLHVWEVTPQGAVLRTVLGVPGAVDIQVRLTPPLSLPGVEPSNEA